ncbi:MAG TPA: hypothetical protein VGK35_00455 [Actinotalea sp.]
MAVQTQLFAGTHDQALARAEAFEAAEEAATAPHVDAAGVTPFDLEALGEIAARHVRFGTGDLEVAEVDLDHERLFQLSTFLCEVLVELGASEDPEALSDVAVEWAAWEEMAASSQDLLPLLTSIVALATNAQDSGDDVYVWVED